MYIITIVCSVKNQYEITQKNKFQTGGAVSTECPEATLNPQLSATNEQRAIADTEYNVTGGTPESACGNCASFDVSQRMKQCMQDGGETVGYCWANQFKCDAAAICNKWREGGPVTDDQASYDIGARYTEESQPAMPELQTAQYGGAVRLPRAATGYESDWSGKDASFRGFVDDRQYTPFLHTPRPQFIPRMAGTKFGDGLGVLAAAADMFRNTGRRNRAPESDPRDYQRHKYSSREGVNLADYTMHPGEKYTPIKKDALRDMYEQYSYGTIGTDSRGMGTLDFNPRYEADLNRPATGTYGLDQFRDLENNSDLLEKIKPILQGNPYYTINGQPTGVPLYRTASAKTTDNMPAARRYGGSLPQAQSGGQSQVFTYENNPEWFDNQTVIGNNPKASEFIKKLIYAGTHGYNPSTNTLHKLDVPVHVPPATQEMATEEWGRKSHQERFESPTSAGESMRKGWVGQSMQDVFENPITYVPGAIASLPALAGAGVLASPGISAALTAPAVIAGRTLPAVTAGNMLTAGFAGHGLTNIGPNIKKFAQDPSWMGALDVGVNALEIAPLVGPTIKGAQWAAPRIKEAGAAAFGPQSRFAPVQYVVPPSGTPGGGRSLAQEFFPAKLKEVKTMAEFYKKQPGGKDTELLMDLAKREKFIKGATKKVNKDVTEYNQAAKDYQKLIEKENIVIQQRGYQQQAGHPFTKGAEDVFKSDLRNMYYGDLSTQISKNVHLGGAEGRHLLNKYPLTRDEGHMIKVLQEEKLPYQLPKKPYDIFNVRGEFYKGDGPLNVNNAEWASSEAGQLSERTLINPVKHMLDARSAYNNKRTLDLADDFSMRIEDGNALSNRAGLRGGDYSPASFIRQNDLATKKYLESISADVRAGLEGHATDWKNIMNSPHRMQGTRKGLGYEHKLEIPIASEIKSPGRGSKEFSSVEQLKKDLRAGQNINLFNQIISPADRLRYMRPGSSSYIEDLFKYSKAKAKGANPFMEDNPLFLGGLNQQGGELPKAQNGLGTVLDWPRQTPGVVAVDEAGAYSKKLPAVTVEAENPWGPYYNTLTEDQKQWLRNHPNDDDATTRSIKAQASQGYGIDGNPTFGESVEDAANRTLYGLGHLAGEIGLVKPIYRTLERTYEEPRQLAEDIVNTGTTLAQMSNPYGIANEFYQGAKSYLDESAEPYYPFISGKNIVGEDKWSGLAATADASAIVPFAGPLIRTGKAVSKPVVGALKQLRTPSLSDFLPSTGYTPPPVVSSLFPKPVSYAVPPGKGGAPRTNITPEHDQLERLLKETERIKKKSGVADDYGIVYGGPTGRQLANPKTGTVINLPQQRLPEQIPFDIENYYHMMSQRGGKGNMDHLRKLVKIRESGMKMDKFFSNLDWTSDGKTLWNKLGSLNATVLTGGKELGASANAISTGKRGWVKKNLNLTGDKVIIEKQKELYASPSKILIDDTPSVVDKFRAAGGNAILHTSSRSTVRQLNKMLKENPNLKDGIYTDLDGVLVDLKGGVEKYGQAVPPGKGWGSGMISPTETLPAHLNESLATKIDVSPNYKDYLKVIRGVGKESTLGRLTASPNLWHGKKIEELERGIKYLEKLETNPRYEGAMKMVTPDEGQMLFGKGGVGRTKNDKGKEVLEIPLKKELQELHKKFTTAKGKPGEKDYVPPSVQDGIIGGKNAKPLEGVSESDHIALAESYHQDIGSGRPSGLNIDLKQMYDGLLAGFKKDPSLMGKDSGRQMAIDNGLVKEYEAAREEASKWLVKTGKKTQTEIDEILGQGRSMGREVTDKQFPDIVDLGSTEGFISTTPLKGPYKELISEVNYKQGIPAAAQYKAAWLEYANPKNIGKEFMPASNLSTDSYVTSIKALTKAVKEGKFSYDKAGRPKIQVHGYNPYNDAGFTTGVDPNILRQEANTAIAELNAVIATKTKGVTPEKVPFIATEGLPAKAYVEASAKKDLKPAVQARLDQLGKEGLKDYMKYTGKSKDEVVEAFEKIIEKEEGIKGINQLRENAAEIFKHVGGDAHPVISITRKEGGSLPIAQNGNGFYDAFEDWLGDYEVPDHEITWGDFDEEEEFPDESWEPGMGGVDWGRPTSDIAPDVTMESDYGKGFFEPMGDRSKFRKDYRKEKNINNPDLTGKQRRGIRGDARDAAWEENPNMFGAAPFNKMNEFFNKKGVKQVTGTLSDATVFGDFFARFLGQRNQNKKYYDWREHGTDTASIYGTEPGGQPLQRGTFNVNSGTFVDDSKVAETRWVGYGGETTPYSKPYPRYAEQGGEIVDVDEATLRKLIAAGAGLEIL